MHPETPDPVRRPLASFLAEDGNPDDDALAVRMRSVRIGQAPQNEIILDDDTVSSYHARLDYGDGAWRLTDLESKNGTYVEGVRLAPGVPTSLQEETPIVFGTVRLLFRSHADSDPEAVIPEATHSGASVVRRNSFRLPLWLLVLLLLFAAALAFFFFSAGGDPPPSDAVIEPIVAALRHLSVPWSA